MEAPSKQFEELLEALMSCTDNVVRAKAEEVLKYDFTTNNIGLPEESSRVTKRINSVFASSQFGLY